MSSDLGTLSLKDFRVDKGFPRCLETEGGDTASSSVTARISLV